MAEQPGHSDQAMPNADNPPSDYSIGVADKVYHYYEERAKKARQAYRISETTLLIISASVPVSGALSPSSAAAPAILGSIVVVIAGLRAIFHWQDNYLRFSGAREAVESERRKFHTWAHPYDKAETRAARLTDAVTRIEQGEMAGWVKIASERPRSS